MNFKYFKALAAALPLVCLTACMDFDNPGDEITTGGGETVPPAQTGDADKLDYTTPVTVEELDKAVQEMGSMISQIKSGIYYAMGSKEGAPTNVNQYQYFAGMTTMPYAGYFVNAQSWGGRFVSTGSYYHEFLDGPYGAFVSVKNQIANFLNSDCANKFVEMKAVALLMFNYSAMQMVDLYGSIPYSDHKKNKESNPFTFENAWSIYQTVFTNLDDIIATLKNFENRPNDYKELAQAVLLDVDPLTTDKSFESWARVAASLKLRYAMHIVKYDAAKAKQYAEEAIKSGVIENIDQEAGLMARTNVTTNPIFGISESWGDSRCSAQFHTLLKSLDHPFADIWFGENPGDIANTNDPSKVLPKNTKVVGIRCGVAMPAGQGLAQNKMFAYSTTRKDGLLADGTPYKSSINFAPLYLVKLSEVEFLRAEGALRGWDMGGGDAQSWYEKGIRDGQIEDRTNAEVTHHWADYVDDYMQLENAVEYTYEDPMDEWNNDKSPITVGVKWNPSDSPEVKLEKIITQKYLSMFPSESYEAWGDLRRTGYPRLLTVVDLDEFSDGSLHDGDIIRKIPLPGRGTAVGFADIESSGIEALGGTDTQGTRVFWDVNAPNF